MHKIKHLFTYFAFLLISFNSSAERVITLRVNDSYAPFEYVNKDGKPVGFTIEVFNALNEINHFNYDTKSNKQTFNYNTTVLDSAEIVTSMDSIPKNGKFIISKPFGYIDNDIVTRIYSDIDTWTDLDGKNVLIVKGSPLISYFESSKININFSFIKNVPDGLRLLSSGKYDAMITSNDAAYYYINKHKLTNLTLKQLFCQPLAIKFVMLNTPENSIVIQKINSALQTIKSNGSYDAIYSNRFFPHNEENLQAFELWIIIIAVSITMMLIFYILYINWLYQAEKRKKNIPVIDDSPLITNLQKIFDSNPTITIYFDSMGRIKFINKAGYELVNTSRRTKLYLGQHSMWNHTILNSEMIDNLKNGKTVNFTYNLLNNNETFNHLGDFVLPHEKVYHIEIVPIANFGTALTGYFAYIFDITEKHCTYYNNIKLTSSLAHISDSKFVNFCYYDNESDRFFSFSGKTANNTGITYEQALTYLHPLSRSQFIDEFLSILNGEKSTAQLTLKSSSPNSQIYTINEVTLNAIRADINTTIGVSIIFAEISDKIQLQTQSEAQHKLSYLLKASGYQFFEYNINKQIIDITTTNNSHKLLDIEQFCNVIHPDDYEKSTDIINDLKTGAISNAYLVLRIKTSSSNHYQYYSINLHSQNNSEIIIGIYRNITDNMLQLRDLEEFKECTSIFCETNCMGYFEYTPNEKEPLFIPPYFTNEYGIDDENFINLMDNESQNAFNVLLDKMNTYSHKIESSRLNIKSPDTGAIVKIELYIIPISDDLKQEVYKYMGFLKDLTQLCQ